MIIMRTIVSYHMVLAVLATTSMSSCSFLEQPDLNQPGSSYQGQGVYLTTVKEKHLSAINFLSVHNEGLGIDLIVPVEGSQLTYILPFPYNTQQMVASFVVRNDATVSIGGIVQKSGLTVNDFSSPVTYTVEATDGTVRNYRVEILQPETEKGEGRK